MNPSCFRRLALLLAVVAAAGPWATAAGNIERSIKIIQTADPHIPLGLRADVPNIGTVDAVIVVDTDGTLADWLLLNFTHQVYADAAVDALRIWRYEPAVADGRPISARTTLRLGFEARGRVVSTVGIEVFSGFLESVSQRDHKNLLADPSELDRPLAVERVVDPRFPASLAGPSTRAVAVLLDFYVDERGRPRMPVVVNMTHPMFAAAAVEALEQWTFAVPTRRGQPVIVRAQQEFVLTNIGSGS